VGVGSSQPETTKERLACPSNLSQGRGRLKETEPTGRGSPKDVADASLVCFLSVGQWRRDVRTPKGDLQ
jgi:hypothetical protein